MVPGGEYENAAEVGKDVFPSFVVGIHAEIQMPACPVKEVQKAAKSSSCITR